jgi:type VI secretion system protein ImpG
MDPRILKYYNRELQHVREMGAEFAAEYPKIAGRLGLEGFECADPYVERLLEGFAFLAARVQLKLDAQFPAFTQHLLDMVYPHYLTPVPSMAVVHLGPDLTQGSLAEGYVVPRDSTLRSVLAKGDQTPSEYRTAHEVTLWPLEIYEAEYLSSTGAVAAIDVPEVSGVKAAIRLRLRTTAGLKFNQLSLDCLPLFLRGGDELPMHVYEQLLANVVSVVVRPTVRPTPWREVIDKSKIQPLGFADDEALLPFGPQSFQGYRLLHEYFAFPSRFMFVEIGGLGPAVRRCEGNELELVILLNRSDNELESALDANHFNLFCTPAINLFPKRADRLHLSDKTFEYHILPDRTRPLDFEVYEVTGVVGIGTEAESDQEFLPFYAANDLTQHLDHRAYYALHRVPRVPSSKQRQTGSRSSYIGSETYISLVDSAQAPYRSDLKQLALETLCTNRDLPMMMPIGKGDTDFTLPLGGPVKSLRCVAGPTKPRPPYAEGEVAWRLISHLSLNYLSLGDTDDSQGAASLRELLSLYTGSGDTFARRQVEGIRSVRAEPIIRRVPGGGPAAVARGLEVTVTLDEAAFEGTGEFLIGAVLEQFFAKYVSINAFTETVVKTLDRGEVMRWPIRIGRRHRL